jgi:GTP-binding protein HflX
MSKSNLNGNISGLPPLAIKSLDRLYNRKLSPEEMVSLPLAREIWSVSQDINRRVGLLISREGVVREVIVGTHEIIYLPDLGRYRLGRGRLRRLRLVVSDLSAKGPEAVISSDLFTDLEKLRLDAVLSFKSFEGRICGRFAYIQPSSTESRFSRTENINDLTQFKLNFADFISGLEDELAVGMPHQTDRPGALLVGVYDTSRTDSEASMEELKELARAAGTNVLGSIIQRKKPDPRTLLGKGKLEEVTLQSLRLGADIIIFDAELKPGQWRAITNSTELKVLDRSMLILDIFAQRAKSSDGRTQVELAQLKYNLPRLVEKDAGLSRLTGGIGGRGPGETKLEIGRRRIRDRIKELENKIDQYTRHRELRRKNLRTRSIPIAAIVGYTNVGKSTLFNRLTGACVITEDQLFATLDPSRRKLANRSKGYAGKSDEVIISDTVGFIRDLPQELMNAFRATLEELNEASLIIHVLDASDKKVGDRKDSVDGIIKEMRLADLPCITVLNKTDLINFESVDLMARDFSAIPVSATSGAGLEQLEVSIRTFFSKQTDFAGPEKGPQSEHVP